MRFPQSASCMGMRCAHGPIPEKKDMIDLLHSAVDLGVSFFDTAEDYSPYTNEELLGEALQPCRKEVVIGTKFGGSSRPEHIRECLEGSLKRLRTFSASACSLFPTSVATIRRASPQNPAQTAMPSGRNGNPGAAPTARLPSGPLPPAHPYSQKHAASAPQ